jgi:diguanylate cyclase (GGDEF)-like protein/PAS domain S-box-containing protein
MPAQAPWRTRPHWFRLTRRVFWDLAIYMVGLGLTVGAVFPPFAVMLDTPADVAYRPSFVLACLLAGFLLAVANYALCRVVVGGRLALLATRLRLVADTITHANLTGDWSQTSRTSGRIARDSDDELGETAGAFNSLLDALEEGEHFRSLVHNASDVITVVEPSGLISYQTPSVRWVLGSSPSALIGTPVQDLVHPEDSAAFGAYLSAVVDGTEDLPPVSARMRHDDGSWRATETVGNNLLDDAAVEGIALTTRDVTERKDLEERLRHQAFHDPLTGLANRALFMDRIRLAQTRSEATGAPLAVLFLDLDNLKTVNDSCGHEGGDSLLVAVGKRLEACVRHGDTVARLSGDEFAILLEGADSCRQAPRLADRVLASLREPVYINDRLLHTGVSIGIATTSTCTDGGPELLQAADVAMYAAKTKGKGQYEVFRASHHSTHIDREQLRADLQQAFDEEQLVLHYQPIVDLTDGRVRGFEALLRWQHPVRGLVPPSEFIPVAEASGLIVPIGRWVLEEACRQASSWQLGGAPRPVHMSVNVSAFQFQHPDLVDDVETALRRAGLDNALLTLEITETLLLQNTNTTMRKLEHLKALGVRMALDDFGTGYSSLSYLRRFPIDTLKMDKSFVDGVPASSEDCAVARAIVQLGHTLHLEVVAEGVEIPEQVEGLVSLGCRFGQGYHFAPALPALEAGTLLDRSVGRITAA